MIVIKLGTLFSTFHCNEVIFPSITRRLNQISQNCIDYILEYNGAYLLSVLFIYEKYMERQYSTLDCTRYIHKKKTCYISQNNISCTSDETRKNEKERENKCLSVISFNLCECKCVIFRSFVVDYQRSKKYH